MIAMWSSDVGRERQICAICMDRCDCGTGDAAIEESKSSSEDGLEMARVWSLRKASRTNHMTWDDSPDINVPTTIEQWARCNSKHREENRLVFV